MKEIKLTQGKFAIVDDADFDTVNKFKWCAYKKRKVFYAARTVPKSGGGHTTLYLHQFLMPGVALTDHHDGDGLNNQRHNLRPASALQNKQSFHRKRERATSRFRGVSWCRERQNWQSHICLNGKRIFLGRFISEKSAAQAYDKAAKSFFGDFASPNFSSI